MNNKYMYKLALTYELLCIVHETIYVYTHRHTYGSCDTEVMAAENPDPALQLKELTTV